MTSFPVAQEWGHPRWWPEGEDPPFSTATTIGVEMFSPSPGWRQFRCRHLGIKMAGPQVTPGGSQTPVKSSEKDRPSPKTSRKRLHLFFYFLRSIWSLASSNHSWNGWGICPLATTGKSISLHVSTQRSMKHGVDFRKHLFYFFFLILCF